MLHPNTSELTVSSQIGMAGSCTIEFGKVSYATYVDPEDGQTYVEFEPENAEKYSWFLSVNGVGITAYCNHVAHQPCPAEFLAMVERCAILALSGNREAIVEIINDYRSNNTFVFGE